MKVTDVLYASVCSTMGVVGHAIASHDTSDIISYSIMAAVFIGIYVIHRLWSESRQDKRNLSK